MHAANTMKLDPDREAAGPQHLGLSSPEKYGGKSEHLSEHQDQREDSVHCGLTEIFGDAEWMNGVEAGAMTSVVDGTGVIPGNGHPQLPHKAGDANVSSRKAFRATLQLSSPGRKRRQSVKWRVNAAKTAALNSLGQMAGKIAKLVDPEAENLQALVRVTANYVESLYDAAIEGREINRPTKRVYCTKRSDTQADTESRPRAAKRLSCGPAQREVGHADALAHLQQDIDVDAEENEEEASNSTGSGAEH